MNDNAVKWNMCMVLHGLGDFLIIGKGFTIWNPHGEPLSIDMIDDMIRSLKGN